MEPEVFGRSMVGCLVLADRIRVGGVFASSAKVQVSKCVKQLHALGDVGAALCGALRYSTKTGREDRIPPRMQRQLEAQSHSGK